jgi:hypothetical protein
VAADTSLTNTSVTSSKKPRAATKRKPIISKAAQEVPKKITRAKKAKQAKEAK